MWQMFSHCKVPPIFFFNIINIILLQTLFKGLFTKPAWIKNVVQTTSDGNDGTKCREDIILFFVHLFKSPSSFLIN